MFFYKQDINNIITRLILKLSTVGTVIFNKIVGPYVDTQTAGDDKCNIH